MTTKKPTRPSVKLVAGHATTTSTALAQFFGRRHKDVLRAIENLKAECPPEYHERNFAPMVVEVDIGSGATRKDPAYQLTRDGFTLLAMGFTGKAALAWKIKYIEAFNKLEARATQRAVVVATRKIAAEQAAERRKLLPAPRAAISSELQSAIDKRAFDLSHAAYAHYRHRMATDVLVKSLHTRPEDWKPEECRVEVLECIELASCMMETFIKSLRNRGIELGRMVGADFDIAAKRFRRD
ncbi:MAG: Rha family transcriptional regulator [Gallionellaceae bacterium]